MNPRTKRRAAVRIRGLASGLVAASLLSLTTYPLSGQAVLIDETRPLAANASVELRVVLHDVTVERWDRSEIQITGSYDSRWEAVEISGNEAGFRFEIRHEDRPRGQERVGPDQLAIHLPEGIRLSVWNVSGDIRLTDLRGSATAHSVSGAVSVEGAMDAVAAHSTSGSVRFEGTASSVRLNTVSGSASLVGNVSEARLNSVSGAVALSGSAEVIDARSVSGRVEVTSGTPVRSAQLNSVSGAIRFTGALSPGGLLGTESHSGSVDLTLGSATAARFDLSTFSGRIESSFPGAQNEVRSQSRFSPNESLTFTTGSGAGRVEARSFSGSVRIRAGGP